MGEVLEKLEDNSVILVELNHDNTELTVWELCDNWYSADLNKSEVLKLADELCEIAGRMVE